MSSQSKTFNEKYREAQEKKSLSEIFEAKKIDESKKSKKAKQKNKSDKAAKISYDFGSLAHKNDLHNLATKDDLKILQKEIRNIRGEFVLYLIIAALIQSGVIFAMFKFLL